MKFQGRKYKILLKISSTESSLYVGGSYLGGNIIVSLTHEKIEIW
jgi:hypothetical protein